MKKEWTIALILILILAPIVLAQDQKEQISVDEALKYYCQTWINPAYYENPNMTGMNNPAASSEVSPKDEIYFIVASDGVLNPQRCNKKNE